MWPFRSGLLHFQQTDNNYKNKFNSKIIWLESLSLRRQPVQKSVSLLFFSFGFPPELTLSSFSRQRSFPGRPGLPSGSTHIKRQSLIKAEPKSLFNVSKLSAMFQVCWKPGNSIHRTFAQGDAQNDFFFLTEIDPSWFSVLWVASERHLTCQSFCRTHHFN